MSFVSVLLEIEKELKIVLIGVTGSGKSSTGNTILGRSVFASKESASSVTFETKMGKSKIHNRTVCVVDTPGVFDTGNRMEYVKEEIAKCIAFTIPGPHAIVLVIKIGPFTKESKNTIEYFASHYGDDLFKYVIILFSNIDNLDRESLSLKQFVEGSSDLLSLVKRCGGRYLGFNNIADDRFKKRQVLKLLKQIDMLVEKNDGMYYTNDVYNKAKEALLNEMRNEAEELQRQHNLQIRQIEDELNESFANQSQMVSDKIKSLTSTFDKERQKIRDEEYARSISLGKPCIEEDMERTQYEVTEKVNKKLKISTENAQKRPSFIKIISNLLGKKKTAVNK